MTGRKLFRILKDLLLLGSNMKKVMVTTSWDDGHVLDLKLAALLNQHAIKGTFYISPKNRTFGTSELLSDEQVIQLSQNFEIGAHTMTHPKLSTIRYDEAEKEMRESKEYLEHLIRKPVESFCYPSGDYNKTHVALVQKIGFRLARTVKRFSLGFGKKVYEMPTSMHAYDHWSDLWHVLVFVRFNPVRFFRCYRNWDTLSKEMFDRVMQKGGVFHLWGHSWEIKQHNDWDRLENVLKYISNRKDVQYVTNKELL